MPELAPKLNKNKSYWLKLLCIVVPIFLIILFFNLSNWFLIIAIISVAITYIFFKDALWVIFLCSLPLISFGQFIYAEIRSGWVYEISLTEILLVLVFVVYILDKFLNGKLREIKFNFLSLLLLLYLFISVATINQIRDFHFYIGENKVFVFAFFAYFLSLNLIDNLKKFNFFIFSLAITVITLSIQIFSKFYQMGFSTDIFFHRNDILLPVGALALVVAIIAMCLPVLIAYYFQIKNTDKSKIFYFATLALNWLAVFISLGKGAILSLFAGMFFLLTKIKEKRLGVFIALSVFLVSSLILLSPYASGLANRFANTMTDKNSQYRMAEYETSWKLIKDYPTGLGAGQQPIYFRKEFRDPEFHNYVNNFFMQAQLDLGFVGTILVVVICFYLASMWFKWDKQPMKKNDKMILYGLGSSFIVVFLNGLVEVTIYALNYVIILWSIIGVFYSYYGYKKYESISHNN